MNPSTEDIFEPAPAEPDFREVERTILGAWIREGMISGYLEGPADRRSGFLAGLEALAGLGRPLTADEIRENLRFGLAVSHEIESRLGDFWRAFSGFVERANRFRPYLKTRPFHHLFLRNLDRWLLGRAQQFVRGVEESLEASDGSAVAELAGVLGEELVREAVPRIDAVLRDPVNPQAHRAAFAAWFELLFTAAKALAPAAPFAAEAIYRNLSRAWAGEGCPTVHLASKPTVNPNLDDRDLVEEMGLLFSRIARASRERAGGGLADEQPLDSVCIVTGDARTRRILLGNERMLLEELNVKRILFEEPAGGTPPETVEFRFDRRLSARLRDEGIARQIAREVRDLLPDENALSGGFAVWYQCSPAVQKVIDRHLGLLVTGSGCNRWIRDPAEPRETLGHRVLFEGDCRLMLGSLENENGADPA